jgi:phosphomannomutase
VSVHPDLDRAVRRWIADDPDPRDAAELADLLRAAATDAVALRELSDRFSGPLAFGTAGLRGQLAAGPNRMNRTVVIRAAAGLASYLDANRATGPLVIGYDARHRSEDFARDTAEVTAATGRRALILPGPLPTPILAFAIRRLGAAAGVMVTASHNPPRDNGYKVYLGDGCQIVPPADAEIAAAIAAAPPARSVPRASGYEVLGDGMVSAYLAAVSTLVAPGPRELSVVYTPLHGVGATLVRDVLQRAGFSPPVVVPEQASPDPDFPTVDFPNPEEPGALDLATRLAVERAADIVVANDPDADRCAVAIPTERGWRMLRGDEVGALLADHLLRTGRRGVLATTIVSSSLLREMAGRHGVSYAETPTGFKWIGRVPGLAYGYEEALGYCVAPDLVRDKDGISALLLVCELAAALKAAGQTLLDRLDELASTYGVHATDQISVRVNDLALIPAALSGLRESPPACLGGLVVDQVDDLARSTDGLPPTEAVRFRLEGGARVVVRPSGTEPKLKCYLEVVLPVSDSVDASRIAAAGRLDAIRSDLAAALSTLQRPAG